MPKQIVVSGGGGFWCGSDGLALDEFALSLTTKVKPRVCYLATAAGDAEAFIDGFYENLGPRCVASHLPLFLPPFRDPTAVLGEQDLIYVSGGSTANMLAIWRLHGIDQLLLAALESGTILYGSSAGGLCWFESGSTDSLGFDGLARPMTNGLGLLAGSHCPHFDGVDRRTSYIEMIESGSLPGGIGVDELAVAHFIDGQHNQTVSSVPGHASHAVEESDGHISVQRHDVNLL